MNIPTLNDTQNPNEEKKNQQQTQSTHLYIYIFVLPFKKAGIHREIDTI